MKPTPLQIRYNVLVNHNFEKIADDYAIEFAHWLEWCDYKAFNTYEELLKIFKKEKGL